MNKEAFHAWVVDMFFLQALDVSEIAFHGKSTIQEVADELEKEQRSKGKTVFSLKFKRKVADFAKRNPDVSIANIARHFFLKDERGIRDWVREDGVEKEDRQHSLLEEPKGNWKIKYEQLKKKHDRLINAIVSVLGNKKSDGV